MNRRVRQVLFPALVAVVVFWSGNTRAQQFLNEEGITLLLSGNTIFGQTLEKGSVWRAYFQEDGAAEYVYADGSRKYATWQIDGNMIHVSFGGEEIGCRHIVQNNGQYGWVNCSGKKLTSRIVDVRRGDALTASVSRPTGLEMELLNMTQDLFGGIVNRGGRGKGAPILDNFMQLSNQLLNSARTSLLDEQDSIRQAEVIQDVLESGRAQFWHDPQKDTSGGARIVRSFTDQTGRLCRQMETEAANSSTKQTISVVACKNEDGLWINQT